MDRIDSGQLNRIKINGFKSIKECDLDLHNINVLIGSNGAGKSNFVSAFTFLQYLLSQELSLYVGQTGVNSLFYNGTKTTDILSMNFYFNQNYYSFELLPTENNSVIFKDERFGEQNDSNNRHRISAGHKESLWRQGSDNDNINQNIISILDKRQWRVYHFHDTSKSSKIKAEHNLSSNKILLSDASNLAAFLYRLDKNHPSAYQDIVEAVRLIAPYFKDFELSPNEGNNEYIVLRWQQYGCEDIFNASQFSDGTLRFICLATLLLQPEELQPATIIIDEPELGLHPYAITIFSELAKKAAVKKQIILSTQSADLLNQFDIDDVIVVDRGANGSEFMRLKEEELAEWLENDYSLGELWNKNILGGRLSK